MIYQDPYSSLNPRMTVHESIAEGINNHEEQLSQREIESRVYGLLESVGLTKNMQIGTPMSLVVDSSNVSESLERLL